MKFKTIIQLLVLSSLIIGSQKSIAQDTLPSFTLNERSGKIIIGWVNPDKEITQIIVQRSIDTLKYFRSIMSMPDPSALTNGYVDKMLDSTAYFYRLFCAQTNGRYFFTASKKPIKEVKNTIEREPEKKSITFLEEAPITFNGEKVHLAKPVFKIEDLGKPDIQIKKDSALHLNIFEPSAFIYINANGNLIIVLPEPEKKHFSLFVYEDDGSPLFNMKNIKESKLLIDKSNFVHSGWFKYELFEGKEAKEKNKFFIPPENK